MTPRKRIEDVYAYALELAELNPTATAIGVAFTVTATGPRAVAGACQIWDTHGEAVTRDRMLETFGRYDARPARTLATFIRQGIEQPVRIPGPDDEPSFRYVLALAAIRSCAVIRAELAMLEAAGELDPDDDV
jgi:hypothetical protein